MAKKGLAKSIIILIILAAGITGLIVFKRIHERNSLAGQIAALSPRGAPPQSIEDLRKSIDLYEKKIAEHLSDTNKAGTYWKILGSRLMGVQAGQSPLYGEALKALENAVRYYPEDESIHYLIGLAATNLAVSEYFSPAEQAEHFRIAEAGYLRAIGLFARYGRALSGLSLLYIHYLNRPAEAVPHMELYLDINKQDTDGMFLLAAAYYMTENYDGAVKLYDNIIGLTKIDEVKWQAEHNRQQVMDEWYR